MTQSCEYFGNSKICADGKVCFLQAVTHFHKTCQQSSF